MTWALCFNCGATKFGALCPCGECGAGPSGDVDLDILFSDHMMSAGTIKQFGEVIKAIHQVADDPNVCFWTFMRFLSEHPSQLLSANSPEDIQDQVDAAYGAIEFPEVKVEPGRVDSGSVLERLSHGTFVEVPADIYEAYRHRHPFESATKVEIQLRDGREFRSCLLLHRGGRGEAAIDGVDKLQPEDVAAMRPARGCFSFSNRAEWVMG